MNLMDVMLITVLNTVTCLLLPKLLYFVLSPKTKFINLTDGNLASSHLTSGAAIASLEVIVGAES
jgi:hypothetical protein